MSKLPDCMMPDGGDPCAGYQQLYDERRKLREALERIKQPTYGTELHSTDEERAEVYWMHLSNFQGIARAALTDDASAGEHLPYCPHRFNKPAEDCLWCVTEGQAYDAAPSAEDARRRALEDAVSVLTRYAKSIREQDDDYFGDPQEYAADCLLGGGDKVRALIDAPAPRQSVSEAARYRKVLEDVYADLADGSAWGVELFRRVRERVKRALTETEDRGDG